MYGIPDESRVIPQFMPVHVCGVRRGDCDFPVIPHIFPLVWHPWRLIQITPAYVPRCPVALLVVVGAGE